jgi:hypothetical protein
MWSTTLWHWLPLLECRACTINWCTILIWLHDLPRCKSWAAPKLSQSHVIPKLLTYFTDLCTLFYFCSSCGPNDYASRISLGLLEGLVIEEIYIWLLCIIASKHGHFCPIAAPIWSRKTIHVSADTSTSRRSTSIDKATQPSSDLRHSL